MACAKVSEKLVLTGRFAATLRSSQVPHPAPIKPLPFGKCFEQLVVVGNRPRPSTELLSDGVSFKNHRMSACCKLGALHANNMIAHLSRREIVFTATHGVKYPLSLPQNSRLSPSIGNTDLAVPCLAHNISMTKPGLFFAPSKGLKATPNVSSQENRPRNDPDLPTAAQLSFILLKLREELPAYFDDHHSYGIYSPDLLFKNKLLPFSCNLRGRWKYQCFLGSTKRLLWCMYSNLNMDVLRITKDPFEGKVEARWRITGRPRIRTKEKVIVDGFSVFVVNPDGLISKHKIEQVMSSKNQNSIRNFIRRRIETLVPAKEPSLTQTDSN